MFGRPGRDSGPPGIVDIEAGKGNKGSVFWQEGNLHKVKAKKPGISFQLFLVVGLAFLQRMGDVEPLNLLWLPITTPLPAHRCPGQSSNILFIRLFVYISFYSMTGIFQNISDLWLENMVHMGEPGLCGLVCFHTTQVVGFFVSAMPGWVRIC